jgi:predicted esterase
MVSFLQDSAEREKFVVVAPDSRFAPNGQATWQVPSEQGEKTDDFDHIRRCVQEVLALPGVEIDRTRTLIFGHSGGASTAPYVASNDDFFTAFAVLHGGAFVGGLGPRRPRGWVSTGDADPLRPPQAVQTAAQDLRHAGFNAIVYKTYGGGHDIGPMELEDLISWWLGRA